MLPPALPVVDGMAAAGATVDIISRSAASIPHPSSAGSLFLCPAASSLRQSSSTALSAAAVGAQPAAAAGAAGAPGLTTPIRLAFQALYGEQYQAELTESAAEAIAALLDALLLDILQQASKISHHRGSSTLTRSDLLFCLTRHYGIPSAVLPPKHTHSAAAALAGLGLRSLWYPPVPEGSPQNLPATSGAFRSFVRKQQFHQQQQVQVLITEYRSEIAAAAARASEASARPNTHAGLNGTGIQSLDASTDNAVQWQKHYNQKMKKEAQQPSR